jgi:hypothetical protein
LEDVQVVAATGLDTPLRQQMAEVAARYYIRPADGLDAELQFGDRVYYARKGEGAIGAFLIVHMDHQRAVIDGRLHQFTYLGLGCADGSPMTPVFRRAKADLGRCLEPGSAGVLHLTTRTPYAIRGIEKAFGPPVFPTQSAETDADAVEIARYLKQSVHRHAPRIAGESPFVLRELKQGRFREEEIARIRAFDAASPLARFGVDCVGMDEIIVFHRFAA